MKKIPYKLFIIVLLMMISNACTKKSFKKTDLVHPFIGTGGHGHTFPGAVLPFGMIQLSPDTRLEGWDGCSGYYGKDSAIYGFSHKHLSGTGCADYCDVMFQPVTGDVKPDNKEYASLYKKKNEKARPGYYSVILDKYNVCVELTCTERAGFHKYTFPESNNSHILIDLKHRDVVLESFIKANGSDGIEGMRRSSSWAVNQHIYFVAKFSKPYKSLNIFVNDSLKQGIIEASGKNIKAYVDYETKKDEVILVKVGISEVSIEGARKNLEAEIKGWDFDTVRANADKAWEKALSKIDVEGGTTEQQKVFYTALYHSLICPAINMDVDGQYRGRDMKIHKAENFTNYSVFSLWDTYRAANPLFTILEPSRVNDFINTFLVQYQQGGLLPVWELSANETMCMIGYHSLPVIVDAHMKGINNFDSVLALKAMKESAEKNHLGLPEYMKYGFIPGEAEGESVSKTMEYAYDDWCIAQFAKSIGREEDYRTFIQRAQYYKNLFDPSTKLMRPRVNGMWFSPFDPKEVNSHYTEANAWQYSFYSPQDMEGLIRLHGGKDKLAEKLNELFTTDPKITGTDQPDISGQIGQYAHGNEPSHHLAYLFSFLGMPWLTQEYVHRIESEFYSAKPDGVIGNEDCGQMSAWYIFSAMGFYPVTPGNNTYIIGTPVFPKLTVNLDNGKKFTVIAKNVSGKNFYIQSAKLNGKPYTKSFIMHQDIINGGELVFEMGNKPNKSWGTNDADMPATSINDNLLVAATFIAEGKNIFRDSTIVRLGTSTEGAKIYYTLDYKEPSLQSLIYQKPMIINDSRVLKAFAFKEGLIQSKTITVEFKKIKGTMTIKYNSPYAARYSASGEYGLVDMIRGGKDYRVGWQGFEGKDFDVIVDLGREKAIRKITTGFLKAQKSWIFLPLQVEYFVSGDGKNFRSVAVIIGDEIKKQDEEKLTKDFYAKMNAQARYIKIIGKSVVKCPSWHDGAGSKAWLFVDEIWVD